MGADDVDVYTTMLVLILAVVLVLRRALADAPHALIRRFSFAEGHGLPLTSMNSMKASIRTGRCCPSGASGPLGRFGSVDLAKAGVLARTSRRRAARWGHSRGSVGPRNDGRDLAALETLRWFFRRPRQFAR